MPMGSQGTPEDRLTGYWDDLAQDGAADFRDYGVAPPLADAVRRFRALGGGPAPDEAFVRRLEETLMRAPSAPLSVAPRSPTPELGPAPRSAAVRGSRAASRPADRRGVWSDLATAAVLLLTLISGFAAFRTLGPPDGEDAPTASLGQSARPAPTPGPGAIEFAPRTPLPEECRVAPRELSSVLAVVGTPRPGETATPAPLPTAVPPGSGLAVDEGAIILAVGKTINDVFACNNAGDRPRLFALFTEDGLRREFGPLSAQRVDDIAEPPVALPEAERTAILGLGGHRRLADGRVGVYVVTAPAAAAASGAPGTPAFFVLAEREGRWLVDDLTAAEVGPDGTPRAIATPAA